MNFSKSLHAVDSHTMGEATRVIIWFASYTWKYYAREKGVFRKAFGLH